jgi:hypothetical protein
MVKIYELIYIFLKIYANEIYFYSSHHVEHNSENKILNGYHMSEKIILKFYYYAK